MVDRVTSDLGSKEITLETEALIDEENSISDLSISDLYPETEQSQGPTRLLSLREPKTAFSNVMRRQASKRGQGLQARPYGNVGFDTQSAQLHNATAAPCIEDLTGEVSRQQDVRESNFIAVFGQNRVVVGGEEDIHDVYEGFRISTRDAIADGALEGTHQQ
jgi:hypothetical protein